MPGAQAMTGRVEEKMGRGRLSSVDADAEKTLSSRKLGERVWRSALIDPSVRV